MARNLTVTSGDPSEGYLVCRWIQKVSAFVHSRSLSILDNRYHILLANGPLNDDGRENSLHQYLGLISSLCMIFQPFGALFRCSPDHPKRSYFNWIHWASGNIAHLAAMGTIFSVLTLKSVKLPDPFYWILASHIVIYVAIHLIMQCHSAIISSKKRVIEEAHESLKSYAVTSTSSPSPASRVGEGFRQFMLGLYLVIITVSTAILVLIIILQSK